MEKIVLSGFADEISSSLDRQIQVLKKLGISHMEIRGVEKKGIDTYTTEEVKEIKGKLDDQGIAISSLASPIGKINIKDNFTPHLEHFKHVAELAHVLNTRYIRMFSFFMPEGEEPDGYKETVFEQLDRLIRVGKEQDVILLHENEKDIYGDSIVRCEKLMKEFYGDHFKAVFDFANFIQCGQDPWDAYSVMKPYIEYIHVKDARKADGVIVPAGKGDGKIQEILKDLFEHGYKGFISLEPHLTEFDGLKNLERDGESLKGMQQMDGAEAFTVACEALRKILKNLGQDV